MVYRNLSRRVGNGVPEQVLISLRNRFEKNTRRTLELTAELLRLIKLLEQGGIPVIALKGPALALQVYGDLGLRHAGDLDLLVHPDYVKLAEQLLHRRGYERQNPDFELNPFKQKYSELMFQHFEYLCRDSMISVDLRGCLTSNSYFFPLDIDQLWACPQTTVVAGTLVKTLPQEETLLYLCLHGAYHLWFRLFWLCDLAQLLHKNQTIDWAGLMARATELGVQRPLAQGLVLSNLLLGSRLPDPVRAYAEHDRVMPRLIKAGINSIIMWRSDLTPMSINAALRQKFHEIKLRRDFRYKLRCLSMALTSTNDWSTLRLPDVLFPLYFVLRPFLWCWRWYVRD